MKVAQWSWSGLIGGVWNDIFGSSVTDFHGIKIPSGPGVTKTYSTQYGVVYTYKMPVQDLERAFAAVIKDQADWIPANDERTDGVGTLELHYKDGGPKIKVRTRHACFCLGCVLIQRRSSSLASLRRNSSRVQKAARTKLGTIRSPGFEHARRCSRLM